MPGKSLAGGLQVLHLRNCIRWSDDVRVRGGQWTLAVRAVLTAAGMVWFASTWYGNGSAWIRCS